MSKHPGLARRPDGLTLLWHSLPAALGLALLTVAGSAASLVWRAELWPHSPAAEAVSWTALWLAVVSLPALAGCALWRMARWLAPWPLRWLVYGLVLLATALGVGLLVMVGLIGVSLA